MGLITKLVTLFDHKKDREYVSEATQVLQTFNKKHPKRSRSQKQEAAKHRDIFYRKNSLNHTK
jgi:hypothetical protein